MSDDDVQRLQDMMDDLEAMMDRYNDFIAGQCIAAVAAIEIVKYTIEEHSGDDSPSEETSE